MQTELQKIARSRNWLKMRICGMKSCGTFNMNRLDETIITESENNLLKDINELLYLLTNDWDDNTKKILKDIKEKQSLS